MTNKRRSVHLSASISNSTADGKALSEEVKKEADNLAKDLIEIVFYSRPPYKINDTDETVPGEIDIVKLVQDLCIYIAARDIKILKEGMSRVSN